MQCTKHFWHASAVRCGHPHLCRRPSPSYLSNTDRSKALLVGYDPLSPIRSDFAADLLVYQPAQKISECATSKSFEKSPDFMRLSTCNPHSLRTTCLERLTKVPWKAQSEIGCRKLVLMLSAHRSSLCVTVSFCGRSVGACREEKLKGFLRESFWFCAIGCFLTATSIFANFVGSCLVCNTKQLLHAQQFRLIDQNISLHDNRISFSDVRFWPSRTSLTQLQLCVTELRIQIPCFIVSSASVCSHRHHRMFSSSSWRHPIILSGAFIVKHVAD